MADGLLNKASIILTPTGYKAGTLYNVAPVVEPYEDFDFARASVASRVNSSGLVEMVGRTIGSELVTNGDFATNLNNWQTSSWWTWNVLGAYHPPTNLHKPLYQQTCEVGKTYRISFDLNVLQGSAKVSIGTNTGSTTQVFATNLDSGSYIYDITAQDEYIIFNRNNVSGNNEYYVDNVSVKEIIDTNNIPRISYDSNGENGHILLEPTSTNLITYSEDFSQSSWTKSQLTESLSDITSPDGTQNAYKLTESNTSSKHQIFRSIASYTELTISFFAKKAERSFISVEKSSWGATVFNLNNGSVVSGTGSVVDFGNGWYRCSASYTASPSQSQFYILLMQDGSTSNYQGDGTSGLYLFGVQAEALSYPTSYIPTLTGSTETRATETATGAGSADLINSTEGVLYAEIALNALSPNTYIQISDNTYNNRVAFINNNSSTTWRVFYRVGGVSQIDSTAIGLDVFEFNKIAISWKINEFKFYVNGTKISEDTLGSVNPANTFNRIDFSDINNTNKFYGKCKALAVFNEALSDAELNNLTG